jgi:uncharacterized protein (TIGR02996 family)
VSEEEALLRGMIDRHGDDTARLVYADWLDERDDPRGAFRPNDNAGCVAPPIVTGCVTTGTAWRFLKLDGSNLLIDQKEYYLATQADQILGILLASLRDPAPEPPA